MWADLLVQVKHGLRRRLVAGFLAVIPLAVTVLVVRFLLETLRHLLDPLLQPLNRYHLPAVALMVLSLVLFVVLIYVIGLLTSHFLVQRLIGWLEHRLLRVPIVGSVYASTKQVVDTLGTGDRVAFQAVVLVTYPSAPTQTIGLVTGTITMADGQLYTKVFVPTVPNPMSGFLLLVPPGEAREVDMTVEEALKVIVSIGIIAPETLHLKPADNPENRVHETSP